MTDLITALLLIVGAGAGVTGLLTRQLRRGYINQTRVQWTRGGRIIHYDPVGVRCLGVHPSHIYSSGKFGAVGLVDHMLMFIGLHSSDYDHNVPLDLIRWIGLRVVLIQAGKSPARRMALIVHVDQPDRWRVYTFIGKPVYELAIAISQQTGLTVHRQDTTREDYGPAVAQRLDQNIYGEWSAVRTDELYLAPDRLLFHWRDAVLLSQMRKVDVYFKGTLSRLNPLAENLLRIEYQDEDGSHQVIGFELRDPEKWGAAIQQRADVPLEIHEGRKKKESGL